MLAHALELLGRERGTGIIQVFLKVNLDRPQLSIGSC